MSAQLLKTITADQIEYGSQAAVDEEALGIARSIVDEVKERGIDAVIEFAKQFGDQPKDGELFLGKKEIYAARSKLPSNVLATIERVAGRIDDFASAQLKSISDTKISVPGGFVGQEISPVERAGCYAPAGRFPLPSSLLMTAVTARAAGVEEVIVASPNPNPITLAAASQAKVDGLLCAGGAHAIAALAYGAGPFGPCDVVVGPGNRFVTAAKQIVFGKVGIDMLAGPSELTILADEHANPSIVAADILAQAEHDPDAKPILVSLSQELVGRVNEELNKQLENLSTRNIAGQSLENGYAVVAENLNSACEICNRIAPEHLEILTADPEDAAKRCNHYGAIFLGESAAEVLGDYGAGPNHTLPTGGTARYTGGLSVFDFIRIRTWIKIDDPLEARPLYLDSAEFAELEGLEGHKISALKRLE